MLKGLVFAGYKGGYERFVSRFNLNPQEYMNVKRMRDIQGIHPDSNPEVRLFFPYGFGDNPVVLEHRYLIRLLQNEFRGKVHFEFDLRPISIKIALLADTVEEIQCIKELPEYLTHWHEKVREVARKRYSELKRTPQ